MVEKGVTTTMVIKVINLGCEKCAKKIKKVLCKIPEIQNQIYDKKANTVTITVVCCNPDKIKQKICCKGGETILGIEIKVPEKPNEPEKKEKPKTEEPQDPKQPDVTEKPPDKTDIPKNKEPDEPKQPEKPKEVGLVLVYPRRTCCRECYHGVHGGPCFHGYGTPAPPPCYGPPHGRPVCDSWGGGGGCDCRRCGYYLCRCEYVCDDNRSPCIIM